MDEWIFVNILGYVYHDTMNNLEHFVGVAFNPLDTCSFRNITNNKSMDIHVIFGIWTQGAIG